MSRVEDLFEQIKNLKIEDKFKLAGELWALGQYDTSKAVAQRALDEIALRKLLHGKVVL